MDGQREDTSRPSDALLAALMREGLHDAEIAVRLGITTGELRERKAELQRRTRTIDPAPTRERRLGGRRLWFALAAAGIAAALVALLVIANIAAPGAEDASADVAATEAARGARQTRVAATPTRSAPGVVVVAGMEMDDLGPFLAVTGRSPGEPVGEIVNRAALIGVRLTGEGYLLDSPATDWTLVPSSVFSLGLRGAAGERNLRVQVSLEFSVRGNPGNIRAMSQASGAIAALSPEPGVGGMSVLIEVQDEAGLTYPAMLTPEGRLLVAREPLPPSAVVDYFTGGELDVSEARTFGQLPRSAGGWAFTICHDSGAPGEACVVSWRKSGRGYAAPAPGTLSCPGGRVLQFTMQEAVLRFTLAASVQGTNTFACEPELLEAGRALIPDGDWIISAAAPTGEPIPVVVAGDGTLHLGTVGGVTGCPCRRGT
ncbi:MAG: hypothetical protein KJ048_04040 [Dehalococcoidia bacterium]|nr:hypothetical protein [Dehalococcoidia bacterium]